jgi:aspartyl-tRNA(Asn)/glutamyl-tRNA(Gln) amidotransferase subunit A
MAHAAIGTDTGGSCRIPAAFCSLVGYKPTADRIPRTGSVPLSTTLDSIGSIARSVGCCETLDALMAGQPEPLGDERPANGLRLVAPQNFVLDDMDADVAAGFDAALALLENAGTMIVRITISELDRIPGINAKGGFAAAESFAWHRTLIEGKGALYDPRVISRIRRGGAQSAADFVDLLEARKALVEDIRRRLSGYDAMVVPTVPIVPPRVSRLEQDDEYSRINLLVLRNPTVINMIDGCAISLPVRLNGGPPVGLMLAAPRGSDTKLLEIARGVERTLRGSNPL